MTKKYSETVFNTVAQPRDGRLMFFGPVPNIARYDVPVHPVFDKLTAKMRGFFWQPAEIDISKDQKDFKVLNEAQRHIWSKTLSYQILLDTIQSRSPALALMPFCTLEELEACITVWCFFEQIHNDAYSVILRNVYPNPTELLDNVVNDDNIISRAKRTIKYYDDFIYLSNAWRAGHPECTLRELKKALVMCMASINALEGLSFYASFACSFAFAEQGLMEGNAKLISLIARDENLHLAVTQNILKKWWTGKDDPAMVKIYQECLPDIEKMYLDVVEQEKLWCDYLFKDGAMLGLNAKILSEYVEYMAGRRMKSIGIKNNFTTTNPLSWTTKYLTSSNVQISNQESEATSYVIGGVENDVSSATFDLEF